jgi:hypothetical protein
MEVRMDRSARFQARRSFLAALSATPAVALLPRGAAAVTDSPPAPPDPGPLTYFYCQEQKCSDGTFGRWSIHGDEASASRYNFAQETYKRFEFQPMAAECRFRMVEGEWRPDFPQDFGDRNPESEAAWLAACESVRFPAHPLDILDGGLDLHHEFWHRDDELFTRDDGLEAVAEFNRAAIEAMEEDIHNNWWAYLLELGESLGMPLATVTLAANGVGGEERHAEFPVRLVRPTPEEIARFSEGGVR